MKNRVLAVLQDAYIRIKDRENWWDGGDGLKPYQNCAITAIPAGSHNDAAVDALLRTVNGVDFDDVVQFNDSHSHEDVLQLYRTTMYRVARYGS